MSAEEERRLSPEAAKKLAAEREAAHKSYSAERVKPTTEKVSNTVDARNKYLSAEEERVLSPEAAKRLAEAREAAHKSYSESKLNQNNKFDDNTGS